MPAFLLMHAYTAHNNFWVSIWMIHQYSTVRTRWDYYCFAVVVAVGNVGSHEMARLTHPPYGLLDPIPPVSFAVPWPVSCSTRALELYESRPLANAAASLLLAEIRWASSHQPNFYYYKQHYHYCYQVAAQASCPVAIVRTVAIVDHTVAAAKRSRTIAEVGAEPGHHKAPAPTFPHRIPPIPKRPSSIAAAMVELAVQSIHTIARIVRHRTRTPQAAVQVLRHHHKNLDLPPLAMVADTQLVVDIAVAVFRMPAVIERHTNHHQLLQRESAVGVVESDILAHTTYSLTAIVQRTSRGAFGSGNSVVVDTIHTLPATERQTTSAVAGAEDVTAAGPGAYRAMQIV